jgi:hypothetical protein
MTSEEEAFGSGIELTQDLDLAIDNTGDIGFESGIDELGKDLAFQTKRRLNVRIGHKITNTEKEITKLKATRIIQEDERISSVEDVEVGQTGEDILTLDVDIVADDGTNYSFVIPVGEE